MVIPPHTRNVLFTYLREESLHVHTCAGKGAREKEEEEERNRDFLLGTEPVLRTQSHNSEIVT